MTKKQQKLIEKKNQEIIDRFGNLIPNGVDPVKAYKLWVNNVFTGDKAPSTEQVFLTINQAVRAGLDPLIPRQIYAVPYTNKETGSITWTTIIGVEGFIWIAESTGQYGGHTKPEYEFKQDGSPLSCTIGVHKIVQGVPSTSYQTVYFDEYYAPKKNKRGEEYGLWVEKPLTMLKKVALVHALRATFAKCGGFYIIDEIRENTKEEIRKEIEATTKKELAEEFSKLNLEEKKAFAEQYREKINAATN